MKASLKFCAVILAAGMCGAGLAGAEEEMPGRALFPTVMTMDVVPLQILWDETRVVDARSPYEYEILHIEGAVNIPYGEAGFLDSVKKLRSETSLPIAFYGNGRNSMMPYQAVLEAQNNGIIDVMAFDPGILEWAWANPEKAVLLGQPLKDKDRLISKEKLAAHILSPEEFSERVGPGAIVLDVRDRFQQEATTLFPLYQRSVAMDNVALKKYVVQAREQNKTLLLYDESGDRVLWLQYFLESEKAGPYYFLEGGARGYYDKMMGDVLGR